MAGPCLPFCHWPAFDTDPCDSIAEDLVCCIEWTMPCAGGGGTVTCRLDAAFWSFSTNPDYMLMVFIDGIWVPQGLALTQLCQDNASGKIFWSATNVYDPEIPNQIIYLMPENFFDCDSGYIPEADPYGYTDAGCFGWPDRLTAISGIVETESPIPGSLDPATHVDRKAFPAIRWSCAEGGSILFEVGWGVWDVIFGDGTLCAGWNQFVAISTGRVQPDWHLGDPFTLQGVESAPDEFDSVVTPVTCNYEPCGESLDCFPDCISGTLDCDGETPAHAPLFLTIAAAEECCLTGTFTLTYVDDRYSIPEDAQPSCEVDSDCIGPVVLTMGAELYCASAPSLETPLEEWTQDDGGLAMLHIWMTDGCGDRQDFYALVILLCDGGLTPATGTFEIDTMCGDNSTNEFDWTLSA